MIKFLLAALIILNVSLAQEVGEETADEKNGPKVEKMQATPE